ncbi:MULTISPECIES: hypothetical protein [unclassified Novosphingobium]|uniref:hypothetical protein n=1 Tax=unclassified Novosphingobium TaxID=2644732 RepID=UPI001359B6B3|nr:MULTISPECIES: hypothetical protein [unclassified Novosphingobium]
MRKLLLSGCAVLAMLAVPAAIQAQSAPTDPAMPSEMSADPSGAPTPAMPPSQGAPLTAEQQAMHDGWTSQQKADYASWPNDYKVYYWTLDPEQQKGYWALTGEQRGQIYKMTPEQRQMAWNSIVQQMKGETPATPMGQANPPGEGMPTAGVPDPQNASQAARPAMPADENYQGGPYKGALTPPPATAMDKKYPKCSKTVTDSCVNRGGK